MLPQASFWQGKKVLLTGHTGFKGSWLALWLQRLGAHVTGLALAPNTQPNLFEVVRVADSVDSVLLDIRDAKAVAAQVARVQPQVVLHLAAQPLVRASYADPLATYATNVMGTAHVLDALRGLASVRVAVMVTTDKVYRNLEHAYPYREDDALGGHDPYSASKAASELIIASYRSAWLAAQGVAVASARAGNVIGGGDWSADRLLPDAVRAWQTRQPLYVRNPAAVRPWQHVLEPLAGYLRLAEVLWQRPELAGAYNFGPATDTAASVKNIIELASSPDEYCAISYYGDSNNDPPLHEANWLALETAKARGVLGVMPRWTLSEAVARTIQWYRAQHAGADTLKLCWADIDAYEAKT